MAVNPIGENSSVQSWASREILKKDDFLKLLITQLRQQDPLDPIDNSEFVAQMTQLTSLEELQDMNENLEKLVEIQEILSKQESFFSAVGLLGKGVEAKNPETGEEFAGQVRGFYSREGEIILVLDDSEIPPSWVYKVGIAEEGEQVQ